MGDARHWLAAVLLGAACGGGDDGSATTGGTAGDDDGGDDDVVATAMTMPTPGDDDGDGTSSGGPSPTGPDSSGGADSGASEGGPGSSDDAGSTTAAGDSTTGEPTLNGCTEATDAEDLTGMDTVMIEWSLPHQRCILVDAGTTVQWMGSFTMHPLSGGESPTTDPASPISEAEEIDGMVEVVFADAGEYPYYCAIHFGAMQGVVYVQ